MKPSGVKSTPDPDPPRGRPFSELVRTWMCTTVGATVFTADVTACE
jgi:hypothetical protein